jgi:hypothetical protein
MGASSLSRRVVQRPAASSTGERASSAKVISPRNRDGGTSRGQYQSLRRLRRSQRRPFPPANWRATVYHGLPPLLHASRSFVEFVGEVGGREKDQFLGNAYAMLFPFDWPEPFGLVMIEALACGTPVIAWRNGSVPEIIEDGATGFVVQSVEEAVEAVRRVGWLDRATCRTAFEQRFDAARMARDYVEVYRRLVHDGPERVRSVPAASGPAAVATCHGPGRRRLSCPPAPLLGVLPGVE